LPELEQKKFAIIFENQNFFSEQLFKIKLLVPTNRDVEKKKIVKKNCFKILFKMDKKS
jgi:hypothetical protein